MAISKVKLPDNSSQELHDYRISGVDSSPSSGSGNVVTSGGVYTALAGKQDTISDLVTIRSGASAGATAYQKPSTGIPASDLAAGVIPTVTPEVLWATYGETSFDTIWDAIDIDKKIVLCQYQGWIYYCIGENSQAQSLDFVCFSGNGYNPEIKYVSCDSNSGWYNDTSALQDISQKVTSISSSSTHSQYPSAKAVYDMIGDVESLINAL